MQNRQNKNGLCDSCFPASACTKSFIRFIILITDLKRHCMWFIIIQLVTHLTRVPNSDCPVIGLLLSFAAFEEFRKNVVSFLIFCVLKTTGSCYFNLFPLGCEHNLWRQLRQAASFWNWSLRIIAPFSWNGQFQRKMFVFFFCCFLGGSLFLFLIYFLNLEYVYYSIYKARV